MSGRSKPYDKRPLHYAPGNIDGQWGHDLFGKRSSMYNPAINRGGAAPSSAPAASASPSLNPFGAATPALPTPAAAEPTTNGTGGGPGKRGSRGGKAAAAAAPASLSLLQRLDGGPKGQSVVGGSLAARLSGGAFGAPSAKAAPTQTRALRENGGGGGGVGPQRTRARPPVERMRADLIDPPPAPAPRRQPAPVVAPPPPPPPPTSIKHRAAPPSTAVIVRNLAEGTTAEDVEAAFNEFGEIVSCEMDQAATGGKLSARVAFRLLGDAERAVKRLHGALADGARLEVTISPDSVEQVATAHDRAPIGGHLASRFQNPRAADDYAGSVARPQSAPPVVAAIPAAPVSKMYADEVEPFDPRASVQTQPQYYSHADADAMDTDDAPAPASSSRGGGGGFRSDAFGAPTGPRNGGGRRQDQPRHGGGGGGDRGRQRQQQQQQAAPSKSLFDRIGGMSRR